MYSLKGAEEEGKHCRSWMSKGLCSKGGKCSFKHDTAKKGKGKGNRPRSPLKRDNSAERHHARKTGKTPSGQESRPPCFNYKRGHCRECGYWHLPPCTHLKKDGCQMGKDCPSIHSQEESIYQSRRNMQRKESQKERVTVAIVTIANHRLRNTSGKLLQCETSMNTYLKAKANLKQVGGILALKRKLPSEKRTNRFSCQSLESKFQR